MSRENNRLMLELEQLRRRINRETINPEIRELTLDEMTPIVRMVADARASYIKSLFDLAGEAQGGPTAEQIATLREQRLAFTELVDAVNALETAIVRGYVDVEVGAGANAA